MKMVYQSTRDAYEHFARQLDHFGREVVPQAHLNFQREIVLDFYYLVAIQNMAMVEHPRDTGWAQGNWRISVQQPARNILGSQDRPPRVKLPEELRWQLSHVKPFQKIWVFNNVPYMGHLEHGHSAKAPIGIVAPALEQIKMMHPNI